MRNRAEIQTYNETDTKEMPVITPEMIEQESINATDSSRFQNTQSITDNEALHEINSLVVFDEHKIKQVEYDDHMRTHVINRISRLMINNSIGPRIY